MGWAGKVMQGDVRVLVRKRGDDEWQDSRYPARAAPPPAGAISVSCLRRRFNGRNAASQRRFEAPNAGGRKMAPAPSEQRVEGIKDLGKVGRPPVWKRRRPGTAMKTVLLLIGRGHCMWPLWSVLGEDLVCAVQLMKLVFSCHVYFKWLNLMVFKAVECWIFHPLFVSSNSN